MRRARATFRGELLSEYFRTGRMIRARVVFLAASAVGGEQEDALAAAEAIELIHAASLFHDDIIDDACERRGLPALHVRLGPSIAMILGDGFLLDSFSALVDSPRRLPAARLLSVVATLSREARECCLGQLDELDATGADVGEQRYLSIVARKTASPFVAAAEMGALSGGADEAQIVALRRYAEGLGICFQICDDVLDLLGDPAVIGKPVGNSLQHARPMLPIIYLRAYGSAGARRQSDAMRGSADEKERLAALLDAEGIFGRVREIRNRFAAEALGALETLPRTPSVDALERLCEEWTDWEFLLAPPTRDVAGRNGRP